MLEEHNTILYSLHKKILEEIGDNEELMENHDQEVLNILDYFSNNIFKYGAVIKIDRMDVASMIESPKEGPRYFIERPINLFEIIESLDLKNGVDIYFQKYENGLSELVFKVHGQTYLYENEYHTVEHLVTYRKIAKEDLIKFEKFDEYDNNSIADEIIHCITQYYSATSQYNIDEKFLKKIL